MPKRLAPGSRLPDGKIVLDSWMNFQPGGKLKADPKTGAVTLEQSDPCARDYIEKQKPSKAKSAAQLEADRILAEAKAKTK